MGAVQPVAGALAGGLEGEEGDSGQAGTGRGEHAKVGGVISPVSMSNDK